MPPMMAPAASPPMIPAATPPPPRPRQRASAVFGAATATTIIVAATASAVRVLCIGKPLMERGSKCLTDGPPPRIDPPQRDNKSQRKKFRQDKGQDKELYGTLLAP